MPSKLPQGSPHEPPQSAYYTGPASDDYPDALPADNVNQSQPQHYQQLNLPPPLYPAQTPSPSTPQTQYSAATPTSGAQSNQYAQYYYNEGAAGTLGAAGPPPTGPGAQGVPSPSCQGGSGPTNAMYYNSGPSSPNPVIGNEVQNVVYEPPLTTPPAVPANQAYYDYTVPQSFEDISKFQANGKWATAMWNAPCKSPFYCFSAFFCPCCCTFLQRRRLLMNDWTRYRCCAGVCGSCMGLDSNCGACAPCCMITETIFCLACAVHGNRFMVMQHYGLQQECCDTVIVWSACILQLIGAILGNEWVQAAADCVYFLVLSCMLTQNEYQMDKFPYPSPPSMT